MANKVVAEVSFSEAIQVTCDMDALGTQNSQKWGKHFCEQMQALILVLQIESTMHNAERVDMKKRKYGCKARHLVCLLMPETLLI